MRATVATIRNLLVLVSVVAIDFGLAHDFLADGDYIPFKGWPAAFCWGFYGSALMANLVVVGGSMALPRRGEGRPFLLGFVIAGAASIPVVQGVAWAVPHDWVYLMARSFTAKAASLHSRSGLGLPFSNFLDATYLLVFGASTFLPELAIASAGGLLASSFRRHEGCREDRSDLADPNPELSEAVMTQKIHKRGDVNPERGEHDHGDVEFADPTNKKYPVDTPEHVRAAWSYINHADNASKYEKAEVETIKGRIKRAAKKHGVEIQAD